VATLVRCTGLSERTVRTCLDRLEAQGIIRTCDPDIVSARIKRADLRRPLGWDLNL
jgi:DNA-binding transcriptional regulator PaaX